MIAKPYMLYILVYILNVDAWIGLSQKNGGQRLKQTKSRHFLGCSNTNRLA